MCAALSPPSHSTTTATKLGQGHAWPPFQEPNQAHRAHTTNKQGKDHEAILRPKTDTEPLLVQPLTLKARADIIQRLSSMTACNSFLYTSFPAAWLSNQARVLLIFTKAFLPEPAIHDSTAQ